MHPDGRGRAVASSASGAQLYTGYRVHHAGASPTGQDSDVGVIATITPDGQRVAVTWPTGDTTWHPGNRLTRVGSVAYNESLPETKAGYPERLVHAARPEEEQRWVELTLGQVEDLLSMTQDRLSALPAITGEEGAEREDAYRQRRSELLVLKGMLLLGRDDPGASR